jgi:hypothetical protein
MKTIPFFLIFLTFTTLGFSQEKSIFRFFYNNVTEDWKYPLIGFINIANGDHKTVHTGFVNNNTGNFSGLQTGFVNNIGKKLIGVQFGVVNTTQEKISGLQFGVVNTNQEKISGVQFGVVNATHEKMSGLQFGIVNITSENTSGLQFGIINFADSLEKGIPIGIISIVRQGGYRAVEYSFSEFHAINTVFKLGIEKIYTNLIISFNPIDKIGLENFAIGTGFGSIIPIRTFFYINPEINFVSSAWSKSINNNQQLLSFVLYSGFKINNNWSITIGPSVSWVNSIKWQSNNGSWHDGKYVNNDTYQEPLFKISSIDINKNNGIIIGARASARLCF